MPQSRRKNARSLSRSEDRLTRAEHLTELPLLLLSFCMVPLLLGPMLWEMSPTEETVFFILDAVIWAIFVLDIVVKVAIAHDRIDYVLDHWLEILVVIVPPVRPLRLVRLILFGSRAITHSRRLASIDYLAVYAIGLILIGSTAVAAVEIGGEGNIQSYPNALWVGACHRDHGGIRRHDARHHRGAGRSRFS